MYVNAFYLNIILAISHAYTHIPKTNTYLSTCMYCMSRICALCFAHARKRDNMTAQPQRERTPRAKRALQLLVCMHACVSAYVFAKAIRILPIYVNLLFIFICVTFLLLATFASKQIVLNDVNTDIHINMCYTENAIENAAVY